MLFLEALSLPAALFLGAMLAAIGVGAWGGTIRVPASLFLAAQALLGCRIASNIPPSIFSTLLQDWPLFAAGILSVVAAGSFIGWVLARWRVLPGQTAVLGSSPGAAAAMTVMADGCGADARLVAVMQYSRAVSVALLASLLSRFWFGGGGAVAAPTEWFPPLAVERFGGTLALATLSAVAAGLLRLPAGALFLAIIFGVAAQTGGLLQLELPPWLLSITYALIGWSVGLRFTRPILIYALRLLPRILLATFVLIAICGLFAAALVGWAGIDPLTAYLATSPGGADAVAIIAASSKVDLPFVMAMQLGRFGFVLLFGPGLARFIASRVSRHSR